MLDFIPVVIKNAFSKPATRNYPAVKRMPCKGQKGHIVIDIDNCIFCGMCTRKCPVGALKVDRVKRTWEIDRFQCVMCAACSESCPKKCLTVGVEYTPPANTKSTDVFVGKPAAPKPVVPPKPATAPVANAPQKPQMAAQPKETSAEPKETAQEQKNA